MWVLTGRGSASMKKAMVPMATFMKESRSSVIVSQQGCWHHFGWHHWSAKSANNFSWSHLQPIFTSCTCIFTIGCCGVVFWCVFSSYSLPCRELPSLQCQVLSRGESTPHSSALVQCTLKMALKPDRYITLLM